ncbi:LysR family transcriptional regulator [Rhizobium sp. NPDC090279]|uniref:LysR family transcriptional regulator n=1 Tax=Rhizobium sp. NPDC090279 TaxID=3364499 RepID=UPI00383A451E
MLIRHLSFFVTLAEEKHFARAAELCHVTQPTLSAAIRKLEDDLRVTLIARGNRYIGLTSEGERVLEWGRQILFDYESLQGDIAGTKKGLLGTLRLGVVPAAMPSVSFLSERFAAAHPEATIEIKSMTSRAIQHGLDAFEIDGGLTYLENEPLEHVQRLPLYHERYVFVCRSDHPLAGRRRLTWAEAAVQPLCLLSEDMQNRRILNGIAASAGLRITPSVVSNSFLAVCSHIRNGLWSSIVPHTFFYILGDRTDLVSIELIDPQHRQALGLVTSDRSPQSPMTRALVKSLQGANFDDDFERQMTVALPSTSSIMR